jgi:hypothetical protein
MGQIQRKFTPPQTGAKKTQPDYFKVARLGEKF